MAMALVLSFQFRELLVRVLKLFFYRDTSTEGILVAEDIASIEKRIKALEDDLTEKLIGDKLELIQHEMDRYLEENLSELIHEKVKDSETIKSAVLDDLKKSIEEKTQEYLESTTSEEIQKARSDQQRDVRKEQGHQALVDTLIKEERSASMLKMVMINLFVAATVMFIVLNAMGKMTFDRNTTIAVVSLYLSLGAFMLYIIRTSHFRSSVLLAIREDERNYHHLDEYMAEFKSTEELNEHDVDVIRMIMTNRSEREHKADHPYEVILKGVSGSNIQFKGGKMALGSGMRRKEN